MSEANNKVMLKMLDRLFAAIVNGPSLNSRPHSSRQRVDMASLDRLGDIAPDEALRQLLAEHRVRVTARRQPPPPPPEGEEGKDDQAQREWEKAKQAFVDQEALVAKLRIIAEDARVYEQDTGVGVLNIGFPLLSLPPSAVGGARFGQTRRILAPIAFIPVNLAVKRGAASVAEIACREDGVDLVQPNEALLAWLEQQTGTPAAAELFEDQEGNDPWKEIRGLVGRVCGMLDMAVPEEWREESDEATKRRSDGGEGGGRHEGTEARRHEGGSAAGVPTGGTELPETPASEEAPDVHPGLHSETAPAEAPSAGEDTGGTTSNQQPATSNSPTSNFALSPTPRTDELGSPTIINSAVLGLFPVANQGLLRDVQAMVAGESLAGPVQSFIRAGESLDKPPSEKPEPPALEQAQRRQRQFSDERFIAAADPFQARAVRLARECRGLVIHGPPGTGKSQTIANIIADHLARGQRVLMVCDKRTAIDVVANRLEHLGLGRLIAVVHDPQRDQRELYRAVREQLDQLIETTTDAGAEKRLARIDRELGEIHAELTAHWSALMERSDGKPSFHELMGQWLSLADADESLVDPAAIATLEIEELDRDEQPIRDLLARGLAVRYVANPWVAAAGTTLGDFLARPMNDVRAAANGCIAPAQKADATRDPAIPPLAPGVDLPSQAEARVRLADRIESAIASIDPAILQRWAKQDALTVDRARQRLAEVAPILQTFRAGSLDAELDAIVRPTPPKLFQVVAQLGTLDEYLAIARTWHVFLHFRRAGRAREVMRQYGVPLSADNAERVRGFLAGLRARLSLMQVHRELATFDKAPAVAADDSLLPDAVLDASFTQNAAALELVAGTRSSDALKPLADRVIEAMVNPSAAPALLDGLRKSPPRCTALRDLEEAIRSTRLIDPTWHAQFSLQLRRGGEAMPTVDALHDRIDTLDGVLRLREQSTALPSVTRNALQRLLQRSADPDAAMAALRRAVLAARIARVLKANPALQAIDAQRIDAQFERCRKLEQQKREAVRDSILHRWVERQKERLLAGTGTRLNSLGADLRRRLTLRGERAMRLRQVVAVGRTIEGGDPLFDMAPVWMASPETVAQVFPRTGMFDAVVFDEASQCRLEEALPVLTRAARVVIAGDPRQLPPTRFFESAVATSEELEVESAEDLFEVQQGEVEDLLSAALNLAIEQSYLDVHYRSRSPELIDFSNRHFYSSRLQPIPAQPGALPDEAPIRLHRVDGVYEKRQNPAEAQAVADLVRDLLSQKRPPSIGIACFNVTQRDLILETLDERAAEDEDFADRLATARERVGDGSFQGLFVKNLENVQGDERDVIIISTTYGPDGNGRFYKRFGPLLQSGGGRRLNVLVTRARQRVHVLTSIPAEAYRALPPAPAGQTPNGAWLLFAYLQYAEQVEAAYRPSAPAPADAVSPPPAPAVQVRPSRCPSSFAAALARQLAARGVGSDVHWGNDGFCVDVAVRAPDAEGYSVGVLCDGSRFTQAEDPVEWDIFRTAIHESQGWKLRRLWTPQFFRDPEGELRRIVEAGGKKG